MRASMSQSVQRKAAPADALPEAALREARKYESDSARIVTFLSQSPLAMDLSRGNPGLFFALAHHDCFRDSQSPHPEWQATELPALKQRLILEWLGFPATEPVRRILAKMYPNALSVSLLLELRTQLLLPEVVKLLAHQPGLPEATLRVALEEPLRAAVTPRLLEVVSCVLLEPGQGDEFLALLRDTLRLAAQHPECHAPARYKSVDKLRDMHEELLKHMRQRRMAEAREERDGALGVEVFPVPPFAGTPTIQPLVHAGALRAEGDDMDHCAGYLCAEVLRGRIYVYKVLAPVRATLAIERLHRQWLPSQVYQKGNLPVDEGIKERLCVELFASGPGRQEQVSAGLFGLDGVVHDLVLESPAASEGESSAHPDEALWRRRFRYDGATLARCDLEDGEVPAWGRCDPAQLPLLPPVELAVLKRCVEVFGQGAKRILP